jgi:hypothetical protein
MMTSRRITTLQCVLLKITKAKTLEIKFDGVSFAVGEAERQALRELLSYMKPAN